MPRPVITPHYGFDLTIRIFHFYAPALLSYDGRHRYDDAAQQFIVNDPGDSVDGQIIVTIIRFYGTIHDYSYVTRRLTARRAPSSLILIG